MVLGGLCRKQTEDVPSVLPRWCYASHPLLIGVRVLALLRFSYTVADCEHCCRLPLLVCPGLLGHGGNSCTPAKGNRTHAELTFFLVWSPSSLHPLSGVYTLSGVHTLYTPYILLTSLNAVNCYYCVVPYSRPPSLAVSSPGCSQQPINQCCAVLLLNFGLDDSFSPRVVFRST